jgi:DNA-binding Xre family transcriptional regulator
MLQLQLSNVIKQRGIQDPIKFLVQSGFSYHMAHRLINNTSDSVAYYNLEKLCIILNCTLNDLFFYTNDNADVANDHPLNKLANHASKINIGQSLRQLPLDKIDELQKMINELKK